MNEGDSVARADRAEDYYEREAQTQERYAD